MSVHIKFLDHGKGSAAHASAYVLDELDHLGHVRAGVEVLRGDANTFNAACDASPHLWKYTSGVIAWSVEDNPTDAQIQEVLDDFEQHAFSGLDPARYHLFAVLHTDDDGSKHIHVLIPRLDLNSGKSLNIAPPGHEKHFDTLRDYFNTKYQWSRPDDLLLMQTTQEPNYVAKLNAQAKHILSSQDIEHLTKKQFCKTIDNYIKTLLKTQMATNRADIVACLQQIKGVASVKPHPGYVSVTLTSGKTHRLKGDFYNEQFEIGLYSERLRSEAESRSTPRELAQALRDAQSIRDDYRAKREAYNRKYYAPTRGPSDHDRPKIAPKRHIDRNKPFIPSGPQNGNSELQSANRRTLNATCEYRPVTDQQRQIQHRFVFNFIAAATGQTQSTSLEHQNRSNQSREIHSNASGASHRSAKREDQHSIRPSTHRDIDPSASQAPTLGDHHLCSVDDFNQYLLRLSSTQQRSNHPRTTENHPTKRHSHWQSTTNLEQPVEITHADRNRSSTQTTERPVAAQEPPVRTRKYAIESTDQFIKDHLEHVQRRRETIARENQCIGIDQGLTTRSDFSIAERNIQDRTREFFTGLATHLSEQSCQSIANSINTCFASAQLTHDCREFSPNRNITYPRTYQYSAKGPRGGNLNDLALYGINRYRNRLEDSIRANVNARNNAWRFKYFTQQLEEITEVIRDLRIQPDRAASFSLRHDSYYPDYNLRHKRLSEQQDELCKRKDILGMIKCMSQKADNLKEYTSRGWRDLHGFDYQRIQNIIKNDQITLHYLHCEAILEPQNDRFKADRQTYLNCLDTFEDIKTLITERLAPTPVQDRQRPEPEPDNKPKPSRDFDFDF